MSRYKAERFNFSHMSERLTFQVQEPDGSYTDNITVWAHILKDGFTRSETDNFFKIMIREQAALDSLLQVNNRLKWKSKTLSIQSWQDPSYEDRGFMEVLTKQIITSDEFTNGPTDGDFFKDFVDVYSVITTPINSYGLISYEYTYNFNSPSIAGIKCHFSSDRNRFVYDKKTDVEHDSLIVVFNKSSGIKIEDYIVSKVHGKFRVDMVVENDANMLEAHVSRSEVQ